MIAAASAITAGSQPKSWAPSGRSSGEDKRSLRVFSFSRTRAWAETISRNEKASPFSRAMSRNGRSVQAAIGDWMIVEGRHNEPNFNCMPLF